MNHARTGNALVLAVGLLAVIAAVMVTTTESAVGSVLRAKQRVDHQVISAAVNATLFRRESMLNQAASLGAEGFSRRFDPAYTYDLGTVGFVGEPNYGIDFIGDIEVRWRIEPVQAREAGQWKQNPRPDGERQNLELPNTFLFRIAAEGRTYDGPGQAVARVQGVRYSAIQKEPLFRYIIFYSQDGAKGDIEFDHGPEFSARGNIHTNGSIYLGGTTLINSWNALTKSAGDPGTFLGPYIDPYTGASSPAIVNAYNGIFRLSKHAMYSAAAGMIKGTAPSGWGSTTWYDATPAPLYPGESGSIASYRTPPASSATIFEATFGATEINPHRVTDSANMATKRTGGGDTLRQINGIAVRGVDEAGAKANDSRDRHRTGADRLVWSTDSLGPAPAGFDRRARTSDNGGRVVRLPAIMSNRPLEPQRVQYDDLDGDPTTDQHAYARPLFINGGLETTVYPTTGEIVEAPGSYMAYALGSNELAFTRISRDASTESTDVSQGYNAWTVTDKSGTPSTVDPARMGLVIRERMQPDLNYINASAAAAASPFYIPYAYGKHVRANRMPFMAFDISAQRGSGIDIATTSSLDDVIGNAYTSANTPNSNSHISADLSAQGYSDGGFLSLSAAAQESYSEWFDGTSSYNRFPRWYTSNWRMVHVQKPVPDTTQNGLLLTIHGDYDASRTWLANGWTGPFGGPPIRTLVDVTSGTMNRTQSQMGTYINGSASAALTAGTGTNREFYSARWTGFIYPPESKSYQFRATADDAVRVWVDGRIMVDRWSGSDNTAWNHRGQQTNIQLEANRPYPIVIEFWEKGGSDFIRVDWRTTDGAFSELTGISAGYLRPPLGPDAGSIDRSQWSAIQTRISGISTAAPAQKLGLMVRPMPARAPGATNASGMQAMADGRDPYLALVYNQTRGVFAEFRGARARSERRVGPSFFTATAYDLPNTGVARTDTLGNQSVLPTDVTRAVRIRVSPPQPAATGSDSGQVSRDDNLGINQTNGSTPPSTSENIPGEGFVTGIRRGQWQRVLSKRPQKRVSRFTEITRTFQLDPFAQRMFPATQMFIPLEDKGRDLQFYFTDSGATTTGSPATIRLDTANNGLSQSQPLITWTPAVPATASAFFTARWRSFTPNSGNWQDWADAASWAANGVSAGNSVLMGQMVGGVSLNVPVEQAIVDGGARAVSTYTYGDSNTFWYVNDAPPKRVDNSVVPFAAYKSAIETLYPGAVVIQVSSAPPAPATGTIPNAFKPGEPNLDAAPVPLEWNNLQFNPDGSGDFWFSLPRTRTVTFDINSYVGTWGSWFDALQPHGVGPRAQVLPWPTPASIWQALPDVPSTKGFRPDRWDQRHAGAWSLTNPPRRIGFDAATVTDPEQTTINTQAAGRWAGDHPVTNTAFVPPANGNVWLRMERSATDVVTLKYAFTDNAPTAGEWITLTRPDGTPVTWSIAEFSPDLLMGPCIQSGSSSLSSNAVYSDLQVEFSVAQPTGSVAAAVSPATVLDYNDWESSTQLGVSDMDRYLAGQYQAFFGPYEITEDFFSYKTPSGERIASESWIYNQREFWSQSRWWNDGLEKDPGNVLPTTLVPTARELLARSTILTIDMGLLQAYLRTATLAAAVGDRIALAGPSTIPTPSAVDTLGSRFNGLIYVHRTNRYPWNPELNRPNPWNVALPNGTGSGGANRNDELMELDPATRALAFASDVGAHATANQSKLHSSAITDLVESLQPYTTLIGDQAPAFRPEEFHHGVRIVNGASIDWGFTASAPPFGTGKTAIVTPNLLYVQGDFNSVQQTVEKNGSVTSAYVPCALMGDQINVLSNAWNDAFWRVPGMTVDINGITNSAINANASLTRGTSGNALPAATTTKVVAALVTHNQPTTKESVKNGEAASIIGTVLHLEGWSAATFDYVGSLVVMDSRRYTSSYQLMGSKNAGPSPFGYMGSVWRNDWGYTATGEAWNGSIHPAYTPPNRIFTFNPDLLTPQGTPPFAPFGTSARGVGGWVRIVQ